jgi:hypothetical protein
LLSTDEAIVITVTPDDLLPMLPPPNAVTWVIEAPTVEQAIEQCACIDRYGVSPQGVQYYVLQEPTPGILGLGKRPALIEAWAPITTQTFSYLLGFDPPDEAYSIETTENALDPEYPFGTMGIRPVQTMDDSEYPLKVAAFEIWVNDLSDKRRQSLILMSEYAYNDPAIYKYLAVRGKPLLASPGSSTHLLTQSLVTVVDVMSVKYGRDSKVPDSYFESIILQLSAYEAAVE